MSKYRLLELIERRLALLESRQSLLERQMQEAVEGIRELLERVPRPSSPAVGISVNPGPPEVRPQP